MKITVIGSGYVGLVSGTCFAEMGNQVTCVDIDPVKIEDLKKGIVPIFEPGLETMVLKNIEKNNLFFTTELGTALADTEIVFIAVGTPMGDDGAADLQYVLAVAKSIGQTMQKELVVVDYKAQSNSIPIETKNYLSNIYHQGYKIQMDIYVHILRKMSFDVSDRSFFYVCNGEKTNDKFDNKIDFKTTLIPYRVDTSWIEEKLIEMKDVLNLEEPPETEKTCEKCAYLAGGKKF